MRACAIVVVVGPAGATQETDLTKGALCRRFGCRDSGGPGARSPFRLTLSLPLSLSLPLTSRVAPLRPSTSFFLVLSTSVRCAWCGAACMHLQGFQRQPDTGRLEVSDASALRKKNYNEIMKKNTIALAHRIIASGRSYTPPVCRYILYTHTHTYVCTRRILV